MSEEEEKEIRGDDEIGVHRGREIKRPEGENE